VPYAVCACYFTKVYAMKSTANRLPNQYPRSLPFRAPENLQARFAKLRRWNIILLATTCTAFVTAVAALVVMSNRSRPALDEDSSPPPLGFLAPPRKLVMPSSNPKEIPASVTQMDSTHRAAFLDALGGLSAVHLYQSYLNIGLVADAVEKEAYTTAEAAKILQTVEDLIALVDKRLTHLADGVLDDDDKQALEHIRAVTQELRLQGSALKGFWATGDAAQISRYRQARARSWNELRDLLGIDE
jgi:hypothetical protein